ncbi:MAG: energy-coupled thiamine transporter ThiT [Oscillospiraceae bacterium]|nr:energy-coupled thiamine transporter ThiT [Oscillospiraceae bacterium]
MKQINTKRMVESGLMMALAVLLSMMKIFQLPYGGSVTALSMLPMLLLAYRYGMAWGAASCFAYSLAQLLQGLAEGSLKGLTMQAFAGCMFFDYILAFTVLCLGGVFKGKMRSEGASIACGTALACICRYLCHIISGYLFFGDYAEWFFTESGFPLGNEVLGLFSGKALALIYSIIYNGTFMIPETVITTAAAIPVINMIMRVAPKDETQCA